MRFFKIFSPIRRVYLDYASSTPADRGMLQSIPRIPDRTLSANPSALHNEGVALKRYLTEARARVASVFEVHSDEVVFTSGATESDNLAIRGVVDAWQKNGIAPQEIVIYTSDIEHAAVSETIVQTGVQSVPLETTAGVVEPKDIVVPLGVRAMLVSVMYVNNEIGTVQPIEDIAKRIRKLRKEHPDVQILLHTDATQAPAHMPLRVPALGVDMMTLGATKLYCNKGVGVLYKKRGVVLVSVMYGGGQEMGLRPGTEPVALIHEFSYALKYAQDIRERETARISVLQNYFESRIEKDFPQFRSTARTQERSPHILHIGIQNFDSELLVIELDARGVAVSAKSACQNEEEQDSPIVERLYGTGWGAVRFSFGRMTTKKDLDKAIQALCSVVKKYQPR